MTIFEYLTKEQKQLIELLEDLIKTYSADTRDHVFNHVQEVCDGIIAHIKKQEQLLVNNLTDISELSETFEESNKMDSKLSEEIGQLVMVHIDEPEYTKCLGKLLEVLKEHFEFSKRLYSKIEQHASKDKIAKLNKLLNDELFKITDFNQLEHQESSSAA